MRLAVAAAGRGSALATVRLAERCDASGIGQLWITEDYFERGAFAVAGAALALTSRVTVGIGVVNPWTRHPVLTAMETAGLAEIAPGRVILGLGMSNARWMEQQLAIPFESPLTRLTEALDIIRIALAGDHVNVVWNSQQLDATLTAVPSAPVPLAIGVKSERALRVSASCADIVVLSLLSSPAYVRWVRSVIGPEVHLAVLVAVSVDRDEQRARERIRPFVATFLGLHGDHVITRVAGIDAESAAAFRAGWTAGRPRVDLASDALLEIFSLTGCEEAVTAGVAAYAESGADTLILQNRGAGDLVDFAARLTTSDGGSLVR